jgi:hypothetical protein
MKDIHTGKTVSLKTKLKMRLNHANVSGKNNPMFGVHRYGKDAPNYGKYHTKEAKKKMSLNHANVSGENNSNWKGGITPENIKERTSLRNKLFNQKVLNRDNFTCVICKKSRSGKMVVDHILPWSLYKELRYDFENARTLDKECHLKYGANPQWNKWSISPISLMI